VLRARGALMCRWRVMRMFEWGLFPLCFGAFVYKAWRLGGTRRFFGVFCFAYPIHLNMRIY
jgi:hypothetical protein